MGSFTPFEEKMIIIKPNCYCSNREFTITIYISLYTITHNSKSCPLASNTALDCMTLLGLWH